MRKLSVLLATAFLLAGGAMAFAKDPKKKVEKVEKKTNPVVEFKTSLGSFSIEVYPDKAPKTVENFLAYVDAKFYDGTVFHRVIADFMIQGGGFDQKLSKKETRPPVVNEAKGGLSNARGTVAMARTSDPNSATAQFFVNVADNKRLDYAGEGSPGYAAFGKVIAGMDTVDKIRAVATGMQGGMNDVPTTAVIIESARRIK
jgi:peptidyl-prolyl cis-trans isomerase A (cyclophilin A)